MKKNNDYIRKIFMSDIHFGKHKNKQMRRSLEVLLNSIEDKEDIDYIILSGDTYDKLLSLESEDALTSIDWGIGLGKFCIAYGIKMRILKGTPSHDRKQLEMLLLIYKRLMPDLDILYFDDIEVVIESDHTCLYMPDEARATTQDMYIEAVSQLQHNDLHKVDSIVMHGGFKHSTAGMGEVHNVHDEESILKLCTGYIVSGHIHKHQVYDRIITPGSVERLQFNEEDPKGIIMTYEHKLNPELNVFRFIENKDAMIFKTLKVRSTNMTDLLLEIIPKIKHYPKGSNIKLQFANDNVLYMRNNFDDIYPGFIFTSVREEEEEIILTSQEEEDMTFRTITSLSKHSVQTYVANYMGSRNVDQDKIEELLLLLEET